METLHLCNRNPHYFQYKGEPTVLIGSGEHYGAVLNRDFDYAAYLDTLAADGLNQTRTFAGTYRESPDSFGIVNNTLAPTSAGFICPWRRVSNEGGLRGGGLYDPAQWDDAYFERLRDFVRLAGQRDIIVELVLFCFWYNEELWALSPMNPANTVAEVPAVAIHQSYAPPAENPLIGVQEALVRKIVAELNEFDNLYFEIINEPYSLHDHTAFDPWQDHIAECVATAEADLPKRHLIARNVQNRRMRIVEPHPAVSVFNYHYAAGEAVGENYHLGKVIADDETGFKGQTASPYRFEAWSFMLSGGGALSHLDYSFTVEHPDGAAPIVGETPGFGGPAWRSQLKVLKDFIESFDFASMAPHHECVSAFSGAAGQSASIRVLAEPGKAYAAYVCGGGPQAAFGLTVSEGGYRVEWIHPITGGIIRAETVDHPGGVLSLQSPRFAEDIAVKVRAR